jgi:hypothetical protein
LVCQNEIHKIVAGILPKNLLMAIFNNTHTKEKCPDTMFTKTWQKGNSLAILLFIFTFYKWSAKRILFDPKFLSPIEEL